MGKVIEKLRLTNVFDPKRTVEVEAVVDTGATMLVLPSALVRKLRLRKSGEAVVRYANGKVETKAIYGIVTTEIRGRSGHFDVLAEENGAQPLVGQIVLEQLDLVVDPKRRRVQPNPQSPDLPMVEILDMTPAGIRPESCNRRETGKAAKSAKGRVGPSAVSRKPSAVGLTPLPARLESGMSESSESRPALTGA